MIIKANIFECKHWVCFAFALQSSQKHSKMYIYSLPFTHAEADTHRG